MSNYVVVARDSFRRGDIIRDIERKEEHMQGGCSWCGETRKDGSLFRYGWNDDQNIPTIWDGQAFCSKDCRDTYYDQWTH